MSQDKLQDISLCPNCNCMTHTIRGNCGKCKKIKVTAMSLVNAAKKCLVKPATIRKRIIKFLKAQGYFTNENRPRRLNTFEKDNLLDAIRTYWIMNPDLRLGQLLINVTSANDMYYYEDIDMLKNFEKMIGKRLIVKLTNKNRR